MPPELQPYLHKVIERKKKEDYLEAQSISTKFTDDEIREYKRRFKEFDADASGGIDIHELGRLMASERASRALSPQLPPLSAGRG